MADIVDRLRKDTGNWKLMADAATEIERLTAEIERLRAALFDIAIGVGENILDQEAMRARAFDALGAVRREQGATVAK